ncbi:hypothetical protein [Paractinoplanes lichenicola]|uniref:DUF3558 domain-containing protein n=1 Tax=Paractinoplanes lichenicola TaxID=2802976 RepID=A0ABS1VGD8_9ACTN|nr:hypothetical protein [Actinoplanes lichenicola]MBL7253678.1 hypothetical protein [Actinoplanes lichenicola]
MAGNVRWAGVVAVLALAGGCAEIDAGETVWTLWAEKCPAWTAPELAAAAPSGPPQTADLPHVTTLTCAYGSAEKPPAVIAHVQVGKNDDLRAAAVDEAREQREAARANDEPFARLRYFPSPAQVYASGEGALEATLWTGNAKVQATILLQSPVTTQKQLDGHKDLVSTALEDLAAGALT